VTDVNDTEISVDKPMTAKRLGLQVVALGEFPALNGVLNVPKTAVCRPLEVDDLGLGKYRCSIQFLATDAPMSYLVEVPANGEWRANPS
jgi:hypothetical protein